VSRFTRDSTRHSPTTRARLNGQVATATGLSNHLMLAQLGIAAVSGTAKSVTPTSQPPQMVQGLHNFHVDGNVAPYRCGVHFRHISI
jgi:hypothetical protein